MARLRRHLRGILQFQAGRPAVALGVRAALAVSVPFTLATLARMPEAGWTGLTGLLVTLADRGGSYRGRARVMGATALLGAVVGALAAPAGERLGLDVVLLLVGLVAASLARCYGESAGATGEKLALIFVASLGSHAVGAQAAVSRGVALLFGGMWALLQALVLWPVHPYLPARKAIAELYSSLAEGARRLAELTRAAASEETWAEAMRERASLRPKIEHARETLGAIRVGRNDEARRGEHLLVLLELSERLGAMLFAIAHAMELVGPEEPLRPVREKVARACEEYASSSSEVARAARDPDRPVREGRRVEARAPAIDTALLRDLPPSVGELLERMREDVEAAVEAARAMRGRRKVPFAGPPRLPTGSERHWLEPLRDNLSTHSVVLRHALRTALVASVALVLSRWLHLGEPYWVVLSVLNILQPYAASTEQRALQRVAGTLLGGLLAAAIAAWVGSQWLLITVIGALTAVSVSFLPLNFGLFQVLLAPDFLLLATLNVGDWTVAEGRALGVLVACGLALAGAWLLWPSPERRRFPEAAANMLRADGHYFRKVAERRSAFEPEVAAARREFGLALLDAEASFERLASEFRGPLQRLEPAMALLAYAKRLAASVTALGEHPPSVRESPLLDEVAEDAGGALDALADSLQAGEAPPPLGELPVRASIDDPVSGVLVERVPRQLQILHGAVEKLSLETEAATVIPRSP